MVRRDNAYSRLVVWLKLLLPLAALGLLASLFLLARTIDPTRAVATADRDVEGLARALQIGAPDFAGVTHDGSALRVTARLARPQGGEGGRLAAEQINVTLDTPGGEHFAMTARTAVIDRSGGQAVFDGDVVLTSSSGYVLRTKSLTVALRETRLETSAAVRGAGPVGTIEAGGLTVRPANGGDKAYVLVFNGGVKLVYGPKPQE